jgi:hypothetical protein
MSPQLRGQPVAVALQVCLLQLQGCAIPAQPLAATRTLHRYPERLARPPRDSALAMAMGPCAADAGGGTLAAVAVPRDASPIPRGGCSQGSSASVVATVHYHRGTIYTMAVVACDTSVRLALTGHANPVCDTQQRHRTASEAQPPPFHVQISTASSSSDARRRTGGCCTALHMASVRRRTRSRAHRHQPGCSRSGHQCDGMVTPPPRRLPRTPQLGLEAERGNPRPGYNARVVRQVR